MQKKEEVQPLKTHISPALQTRQFHLSAISNHEVNQKELQNMNRYSRDRKIEEQAMLPKLRK